jgi:hypothetical protein
MSTARPASEGLLRTIHATVHAAMARGALPTAVELGWIQYGQLYRWAAPEPDGPRPTRVLDLPLVPIGAPDHLAVRVTEAATPRF